MEITGKLIVKGETKEFGSNGFTKREFVIETESQYPQKILIELVKEKTALLENFSIGQPIKVSVNINGREWTNPQGETKYFNSIQGWKIKPHGDAPQQPQQNTEEEEPTNDEGKDDLPF